ncbi:MAG: Rrf2 family transcriptional regulator [Candidatus Cloacimonetes bacterium]|nr:Rrf2 family transcriptional regulator [Candidatus Cloacimonadota bacterium]
MHISTKTGYAVKALTDLALHASSAPVSLPEICERQKLPLKYTEQLFRKLRIHGLVRGIHGSRGGYILPRPPASITLQDIIAAVEDDIGYKFCYLKSENDKYCRNYPCRYSRLWNDIRKKLEKFFSTVNLEQIITEHQENL